MFNLDNEERPRIQSFPLLCKLSTYSGLNDLATNIDQAFYSRKSILTYRIVIFCFPPCHQYESKGDLFLLTAVRYKAMKDVQLFKRLWNNAKRSIDVQHFSGGQQIFLQLIEENQMLPSNIFILVKHSNRSPIKIRGQLLW